MVSSRAEPSLSVDIMNPQEAVKLSLINSPTDIQHEIDTIQSMDAYTQAFLEVLEKDNKIRNKSIEESTEVRKRGNAWFTMKGHNSQIHAKILKVYSKSIAYAPKGTQELALGYSNRSVILMHLHRYKESLIDIDRALQLSKSDELEKKLLARKEKCLGLLNEKNLKESISEDRERLALKLMNFKPSTSIPCASDCVGLAYNKKFGRHLVATRDIEPGEILIAEEIYACYPRLDQLYLVCSHCLQIAWNGIPCDDCVFTIYCSETCKNKAFDEYHSIECSILKYMDHTIFSYEKNACERMAAIRLLTKAAKKEGFKTIWEEVLKEGTEEDLDAVLSDGVLLSDKFKSCYNLSSRPNKFGIGHEGDLKFHTSQIVYFLTKHTDFLKIEQNPTIPPSLQPMHYDSNSPMDPSKLLKLNEVITKLKYITFNNGHSFGRTPWQCDCDGFSIRNCLTKCHLGRGIAIAPCCSLINHSCTPNISHLCASNRKIIYFSTSVIKKGEQLCDSYGVCLNTDFKARQNRLKELNFTCKCQACWDKIDISMIPRITNKDFTKIFDECPKELQNLLSTTQDKDLEMTEEILQYVIKMSQLYYKYFDYFKAYVYSTNCRDYIEKMMCTLYEEETPIPNDCQI